MPLRSHPDRLRYAASLAGWFALTLSAMGIVVTVADRAIGLAVYANALTPPLAEPPQ